MKKIEVVAAIIRKGDKVFATQRGYGDWKDYWEYPGGKVEVGETPEEALVREIREELDTEIRVDKFLCTIEWDYPAFHLTMHCYICSLLTEALHLNEHEAARWLGKDELGTVNWLPADYQLIPLIGKELENACSMRRIRAAVQEEIPSIMAVVAAAKGIMRRSGNVNQWIRGYPSEAVIGEDIEKGVGHIVLDEGAIVGYFAFVPSPEPTYAAIYDGACLDDNQPYRVIHRIASLPDSHGVFKDLMDWCFAREKNIRIDTHRDNHIMQHCITRYGFGYCGIIYLESGDERLAYQLIKP